MNLLSRVALLLCFLSVVPARADIFCNPGEDHCWRWAKRGSSSQAYPSKSSSIKINPSAVPVEKGFGAETIFYKGQLDFALVKGLGRVGAAISPSNGEETFFGPPGFEISADYLKRRLDKEKYPSQKLTLATAFTLLENKRKGLQRIQFNLGVLGKYNKATGHVLPGGGVSATIGPVTLGYAAGKDEYLVDYTSYGLDEKETFNYSTETYSAGIYLTSVALDYSILNVYADQMDKMTISLLTGSLIFSKWILTASERSEVSDRAYFDNSTQTLVTQKQKYEYFGGIQFSPTEHIMLSCFYNYYLLREVSVGLTLFL